MRQNTFFTKRELYQAIKAEDRIIDFLLDTVLYGLIFWDLKNSNNSWISPRLWEILGYGSDSTLFSGSSWQEIIHPDDLKIFHENISNYLKNPNFVLDQELRFKDKNNQLVWIRLRGIAIGNKEDRLLGIFFVSENNTRQKNTESELNKALSETQNCQLDLKNALEDKVEFQALNEELRSINEELLVAREKALLNEKKLQLILGLAPDVYLHFDRHGNVLGANEKAVNSFGYSRDELISMKIDDLFVFEEIKENPIYYSKLKSGEILSADRQAKRKDGSVLYAEINMRAMPDGTIQAFIRDITEKKQLTEALRISEERLRLALLVSNEGTWDWDLESNHVYFDPVYYRLSGYEVNEFPHRFEEFRKRAHPEDFPRIMDQVQKHLKGESDSFVVEFRFLRKEGQYMWILGRGQIVERDNNGRPLRFIGTHSDITDRKLAEEKLRLSETFRRLVFDSSHLPIVVMEADTYKFIDCNLAAVQTFGFSSREQVLGLTPLDVSAPIQYDGTPSADMAPYYIEKAKQEGSVVFEWKHQRTDGTVWDAEVHLLSFSINGKSLLQFSLFDITERKRMAEAIQATNSYLQAVIDAVNDAVFVDDADTGQIIDVNHRCCQMYGYTYEEMLSTPIGDLSYGEPPYSQDDAIRWLTKARNEGPQIFEWLAKRKDGSLFWVEINVHFTIIGGKNRFVVAVRDITERKLAAEALQESEQKFRAIFENAGDALFVLTQEGSIIDCNNKALELFQATRDEFVGSNPWEFSPALQPDGSSSSVKAKEKIAAAFLGTIEHFEWLHSTKSGKLLYTEVTLNRVLIGGHYYLQAVVRDITDRKIAEKEIVNRTMFINSLLSALPVAVFYKDRQGRYLGCNPVFTEITGFTEDFIKGKTVYEVLPKEFADKYNQMDADLIEKKVHQKFEYQVPDKDGNLRSVIFAKDLFYDNSGEIAGIVGAFMDISEIKRAEQMLIKAKEKAEESDRLKTAFLQNMSHEIRTPLNAIMGFASLIPSYFDDKENLQKFTKIIEQRSSDLLEIINDILDISKIESGQTALNTETCDINSLFDDLASYFDSYKQKIDREHITLYFKKTFHTKIYQIQTDKAKLKQILVNLIGNALKYTEQGSVQCDYKLSGNKLMFSVQDPGIGIPSDKLSTIFERFVRLENIVLGNYVSGTGLGLSIVKGLVHLLGGDIWVESEVGKGSTFYFTIDYVPVEIDSTPSVKAESQLLFKTDKIIVIVEDDFFNAEYLKAVVGIVAKNVFVFGKGLDAVRFLESHPADIVLMDVRLPDISGYEATKLILEKKPNLKIIAQTAYAEMLEYHKAKQAGCVDYISKPMNPNTILSTLAKHLSE